MQMLEDKAAGIVFPAVVLRDVAPSEFADIAEPQAAVAGEQVGVSDRFVSAGRGNQPFHLVYRQIVSFPSACLGSLMAGKLPLLALALSWRESRFIGLVA